ncbi:MAG: terminase large subunit, partial [Gammaproteobacteria bacterium]|nr:terminase large subunit [Gammaproteobacteria bacterium]
MSLSYAVRATHYAEAVVAGLIDASKLTIAACQRHLDDLARSAEDDPDFPYVFDEAAANRACGFVEMFPHVKGSWARARELIVVEDWQCFT